MLDQARPITAGPARQVHDFKSGNEAAALAARDIGFHVMGYFPITPSTLAFTSGFSISRARAMKDRNCSTVISP